MLPELSIVIVTYNSAGEIAACLEAVARSVNAPAFEVLVFDNASNDDTQHVVSEYPAVEYVQSNANLGFGRACNRAVGLTTGSRVLLLNPDTEVAEDAIGEVWRFADGRAGAGLYGGRTLRRDGSLEPSSCLGAPTVWSHACFGLGLSAVLRRSAIFNPEAIGNWQRDTIREVGVVTGCFLLIDRRVWEILGGFDERFFMYCEDVDLSMRARSLGYRPVVCPTAELIHEVGKSSSDDISRAMLVFRARATIARIHFRGLRRVAALQMLQIGTLIRSIGWGVARSTRARWRYLWRERAAWRSGFPT